MILNLTYKSIKNRKLTFFLSVFSIAISVMLLLGVDKVVKESKNHFINTINATDLIVAPSNGSIDILLKLVFHISDDNLKMDYKVFNEVLKTDGVDWCIPISLGDSFKGFDVVSTNNDYFKYYTFSTNKKLRLKEGKFFSEFFDIVVGYDVAKKLGLKLGDKIHLSHGKGKHHHIHKHREFKVVGILDKTFTPNDDSLFMQLKTDEAIHFEYQSGHFVDMHITNEHLMKMDIKPKHISGMFVGLKNKMQILEIQERLSKLNHTTVIIPAKALSRLYKLIKEFQNILVVISFGVFITAVFTMLSTMFSTLNERRREIAILRSLGASSFTVFLLFVVESFFVVFSGVVVGVVLLELSLFVLVLNYPINISYGLDIYQISLLLFMVVIGVFSSLFPAYNSYKSSLQDGLVVRV